MIYRLLWMGIAMGLLVRCENDIPIHVDGPPIPIVYCLLDLDHTDQYVRVGRTFRGEAGNDLSQLPIDSLWIREEHRVYVELWEDGKVVETYPFAPAKGYVRDSGFFPVQSLDIYRADFDVKPNSLYLLYVWFPADDQMISAETLTVGKPVIEDPKPLYVREITFVPDRNYTLRWFTAINSGINHARFTINYLETLGGETQFKNFQLYLSPFYVTEPGNWVAQVISPTRFYNELLGHISVNDSVTRELLPMDFTLVTAGVDMAFFIKTQQPTFWMNLTPYTNLDHAFGIFSSLTESHVNGLELSKLTKYFIATDTLTRRLNFINPYDGNE